MNAAIDIYSHAVLTASSDAVDPHLAAFSLADQLMHEHLGFVLFFCSAEYDLDRLGTALSLAFGDTPVAGCTTAGEITPQGYGRGCIVAVGFDRRAFAVDQALVTCLDKFDLTRAQHVVEDLLDHCRESALAPVRGHTFALTLLDGLSSREELVLSTLCSALGSIPHFGGSAGDDNHLTNTHVYSEGAFHSAAAVIVMINTPLDFDVFTTHHVRPRHEKLVVTAADRDSRIVYELNAEPAALAYARLVGKNVNELDMHVFAQHPLAVRYHDQYYVRSIQRINADYSMTFYCAVENGIVMTAMQPGALMEDLRLALAERYQQLGQPQVIIGCDCFLRRLELEELGQTEATSTLLRDNRVIGFNSYGEQFNGMHINQTFTGVIIGKYCRSDAL